jgi:single-stranded-DNA-specific exonuclease
MQQTRWPGVKALIDVSALSIPYTPADVGFGLGPRLNAAGRLASAEASLEVAPHRRHRSRQFARETCWINRTASAAPWKDDVLVQAEAQARNQCDPAENAAIVVGALGWHPEWSGSSHHAAARYHRPTIVVGFDPMGVGKGSGRSIEGLSLVNALTRCSEHSTNLADTKWPRV